MDGGAVWNTNLVSAVQRCREVVDDDSKIIVDIVECSSHHEKAWSTQGNTLGNVLRFREIQKYNNAINDINEVQRAFPNVTWRYYVAPSTSVTNSPLDILDASNDTVTFPM